MFRLLWLAACLLAALSGGARAGYLDENPDEVFATVYERIGALPVQAAREPFVWLRLQELKREPCDQTSISDLALMLNKFGYRRQASDGLYRFVMHCGAPVTALHRSIDIYLKLTDYPKRFPLRGRKNVVTVKAKINGVPGVFILDTGASYPSAKSAFASRAKIPDSPTSEITLMTANGLAKAKLSRADNVALGKLEATNVPVAIQNVDDKSYGVGVDGLLGMSFLSRFEVQMAGGLIEVSTVSQRSKVALNRLI